MSQQKIRCIICNKDDVHWENVDEYRIKPHNMCICTGCGFVSYPDIISESEKLKEFYKEDYRAAPTINNIYAGERKIKGHQAFLRDYLSGLKENVKEPVVLEIGAAFGMFLHWVKSAIPSAKVYGTELTTSFVRNAYHMYGLELTDDFDDSIQYDLIASYKVAEHMIDVDKQLDRYHKALKDDGRLYISVPTWFRRMSNFGLGASAFDLEYYYHKNHVNAWTVEAFEYLLKRHGFEIVKEDHVIYDDTYLCKKTTPQPDLKFQGCYPYVKDALKKIKEAYLAYQDQDYDKARTIWPHYIPAHQAFYETNRKKFHDLGWDGIKKEVIERIQKDCPGEAVVDLFCSDLALRYDKWDECLEFCKKALDKKPDQANALMNIAQAMTHLSAAAEKANEHEDALKFRIEARDCSKYLQGVSMQTKPEAVTWTMAHNAKLPTPFELKKS